MTAAVPEAWTSAVTLESLRDAIETITELTQFQVVVLNLVRGEELVVTSATGFDTALTGAGQRVQVAEILGTTWQVSTFHELAAASVALGPFYFLPARATDMLGEASWFTDRERLDGPGAWHPQDILTAPLWTRDGQLLGVLSLDDPLDGMRPTPSRIQVLGRWVEYANRVVLEALEREQLAARSRLMAQTRRALSALTVTPAEPADLLVATREKLLAAFQADRVGIRTYADPVTGTPSRFTARGGHPGGQEPVMATAEELGRQAWRRGEVPVFVAGDAEANARAGFSPEFQSWLADRGHVAMLLVPMGAGEEAIGAIYLTRQTGQAPWTELERREALELGRDMGRILRSARTLHREQQLAAELRQLDDYRSHLITGVSLELTAPVSEIAEGAARLVAAGAADADAIARVCGAAHQLSQVVDDLLLLSRISDPAPQADPELVDIADLASEAVATAGSRTHGIEVVLHVSRPALVRGWREALARGVRALVHLALRCTDHGGLVTVTVQSSPSAVELTITDTGVGIAPEDMPRVFEEFHRLPHAGRINIRSTGLGLAIAQRAIRRAGGTVSVESAVGRGSTVRVVLPVR